MDSSIALLKPLNAWWSCLVATPIHERSPQLEIDSVYIVWARPTSLRRASSCSKYRSGSKKKPSCRISPAQLDETHAFGVDTALKLRNNAATLSTGPAGSNR